MTGREATGCFNVIFMTGREATGCFNMILMTGHEATGCSNVILSRMKKPVPEHQTFVERKLVF